MLHLLYIEAHRFKYILMGSDASVPLPLHLTMYSCETQSQELFDFHSPPSSSTEAVLTFPSYLSGTGVSSVRPPAAHFKLSKEMDGSIAISGSEQVWMIVGQGESRQIQIGTIIKLGKLKIELKQINLKKKVCSSPRASSNSKVTAIVDSNNLRLNANGNAQTYNQMTNREEVDATKMFSQNQLIEKEFQIFPFKNKSPSSHQSGQECCRICFDGTDTTINPLVGLCKCAGSMRLIHYQCLKDWLSSTVVTRVEPTFQFHSYFEPHCEICTCPLPFVFNHQGRAHQLLTLPNPPEPPYALFQQHQIGTVPNEDGHGGNANVNGMVNQANNNALNIAINAPHPNSTKNRKNCWYVKLVQGEQMSFGRNNGCYVVMKQISVSRVHCVMMLKNGRLFIRDKKSKFGTLLMMSPASVAQFPPQEGIQLQINSKLVRIARQSAIGDCCCAQSDSITLKRKHHGKSIQGYQVQIQREVMQSMQE